MSKNPFLNALAATAYITVIASVLYYGLQAITPVDSVMVPITLLSLFVLSAAMMGYFFLYQPAQLFFENRQKEAVKLFLATAAIFACITGILISIWFFLSVLFHWATSCRAFSLIIPVCKSNFRICQRFEICTRRKLLFSLEVLLIWFILNTPDSFIDWNHEEMLSLSGLLAMKAWPGGKVKNDP